MAFKVPPGQFISKPTFRFWRYKLYATTMSGLPFKKTQAFEMNLGSLGILVAVKTALIIAVAYIILNNFPATCPKTFLHTAKVDLKMNTLSIKVLEKEGIIESVKKTLFGTTDYTLEVLVKNEDTEDGECRINILFEDSTPVTTPPKKIISGETVSFHIDLPNQDVNITKIELLPDEKTVTWTEVKEVECSLAEKYFGNQNSMVSIINLVR